MKKMHLLCALPAFAALAAVAGPYDKPWAIVETGSSSEVRKEARLAISKVDGKSTRNPRKSDPIEPGKHVITVHFETARGVVSDNFRDLQIDLEGCTRYRIVAEYESKTGPEWKPKIYSEPIGECVGKFKKKEAAPK